MGDVEEIVRGLSEAQKRALIDAAFLLDHFAGEGAGMMPLERMASPIFADDAVLALSEAFGIDPGDDFGSAIRDHLLSSKEGE